MNVTVTATGGNLSAILTYGYFDLEGKRTFFQMTDTEVGTEVVAVVGADQDDTIDPSIATKIQKAVRSLSWTRDGGLRPANLPMQVEV